MKDIDKVLGYARSSRLPSQENPSLSLTTNGLGLNESNADIVAQYLDNIKVSLFAMDQAYTIVTGGKGSDFSKVKKGIENCIKRNLPVHVQTSVLVENKENLIEMAGLCEDIGVSKFTVYSNIEQARGHTLLWERKISDGEIKTIYEGLIEEKDKKGWNIGIKWLKWPLNGQYILIFQDGRVTANPVNEPPHNYKELGNVLESTIDELWRGYDYKYHHIDFYCSRD